jgi:virulence-associated protein VapD
MISLLLFLGYLFSLIGDPVYRLRFALFNGSVYIERRDYERAKKSFKKIKEIYSHLTLVEQHVFANDLENFGAHLSELELKQRSRRQ